MFADEARFGRMNRIRPCWAPIGTRPGVAAQLIRDYIYLYGAVSPKDGTCLYLIMPTSNTACFQVFLDVLELNPKENHWDEIREKIFKNYALKSMDAVRAKLRQAILYIERNPKLVRSITSFPYIVNSL